MVGLFQGGAVGLGESLRGSEESHPESADGDAPPVQPGPGGRADRK